MLNDRLGVKAQWQNWAESIFLIGIKLQRTRRAKSAVFGGNSVFRTGAPQSTKIDNVCSPSRYEEMRFDTPA